MTLFKAAIKIGTTFVVLFAINACGPAGEESQPVKGSAEVAPDEQPVQNLAPSGLAPGSSHESGAEAVVMAYGRFVPEREDDFTWENDKVAFRVYGPSSGGKGQVSGVDAWFKKVPYAIVDKWYAEHLSGKSYHEDNGEGYDPFHVGDSRGVGGTAIWIDGVAWPAAKYSTYEILQSGGNVIEFRLLYEWQTPLGLVAESKTISLRLGEQLYRVNSVFTLDGQPTSLPVAIGLTTHDEKAQVFSNTEAGRISTWEMIDNKGVGTAALVAPISKFEVVHLPSEEKDASHIWLVTSTDESGVLKFSAGFAWQDAGEIMTEQQWNNYLDSWADK